MKDPVHPINPHKSGNTPTRPPCSAPAGSCGASRRATATTRTTTRRTRRMCCRACRWAAASGRGAGQEEGTLLAHCWLTASIAAGSLLTHCWLTAGIAALHRSLKEMNRPALRCMLSMLPHARGQPSSGCRPLIPDRRWEVWVVGMGPGAAWLCARRSP